MIKRKPYRNKKILKAANGEPCLMRSPVCNGDSSTTVFCHLNEGEFGKGMGQKADDCAGFFGCSSCHDWYDGRMNTGHEKGWRDEMALRAAVHTFRRLIDKGVIG